MLNKKITALINTQINKELFSGYLYMQFANYFEEKGLTGFSNWYKVQAQEEFDHAMLFTAYLQNNEGSVVLEAIDKPDAIINEPMDALKAGLTHEEYVTSLIDAIYEAAYSIRDLRTMQFLDWFIAEQAEEEKNANDLITKMELFGSDPKGLYQLDQELGARVHTPPSLVL